MKYTQFVVLSGAAICHASMFQLPASLTQTISNVIGILGLDMNNLGKLDLATFGPFVKPLMPIANSFADSGALVRYIRTWAPTLPLNKTTVMEPVLRKTAKRAKARLGPYQLNGQGLVTAASVATLSNDGQSFTHLIDGKSLCSGCTLLSTRGGIEFEDGTDADPSKGVFIHHISIADISRSGPWTVLPCDYERWNFTEKPLSPMIPFTTMTGFGEDQRNGSPMLYTTEDGSYDSGFHLLPTSTLAVQMELVNYSNVTKNLFTTIEYEYVEGIHGQPVVPNLIPVTGCKLATSPNVNMSGPAETVSKDFAVLVDGTIIAMKGHMHTGGDKMVLYLNGEEICTSNAKYEKGLIQATTPCDRQIKVKRGDFMSMKSVYDVKKYPMRSSAGHGGGMSHDRTGGNDLMGMMSMSIALDHEKGI